MRKFWKKLKNIFTNDPDKNSEQIIGPNLESTQHEKLSCLMNNKSEALAKLAKPDLSAKSQEKLFSIVDDNTTKIVDLVKKETKSGLDVSKPNHSFSNITDYSPLENEEYPFIMDLNMLHYLEVSFSFLDNNLFLYSFSFYFIFISLSFYFIYTIFRFLNASPKARTFKF